MAIKKAQIVICDFCQAETVDRPDGVDGIRLEQALVCTPTGGGYLPKGTFICWSCVNGSLGLGKLAELIWNEDPSD